MAKKITTKMGIAALVIGASVVILTPMIAGALGIADFVDLKFITLGTAAVAGVVALVADLALEKWYL